MTKGISNGFGALSMPILEKSLSVMWVTVRGPPPGSYGRPSRLCTGNVPRIYTDYWEAYKTVILSKRHSAVGQGSGLTSYIERLNNTMRQRVTRLVRKALSFSKKLENQNHWHILLLLPIAMLERKVNRTM